MREIGISLVIFAVLAAVAGLMRFSGFNGVFFYGGGFLIVAGLLFSLPCALLYHYKLYRCLEPRGALDRRWIWNPTGHHARLTPEERRQVMPWFYAGAAGWGASVLGCALFGLGALTA